MGAFSVANFGVPNLACRVQEADCNNYHPSTIEKALTLTLPTLHRTLMCDGTVLGVFILGGREVRVEETVTVFRKRQNGMQLKMGNMPKLQHPCFIMKQ